MKFFDRIKTNRYMKNPGVYKISEVDFRDYIFATAVPLDDSKERPVDFLVSNRQTTLYNQGPYGMCVGYGFKRELEQWKWKNFKSNLKMSAGYPYYNRVNTDYMKMFSSEGMIVKEGLKHLLKDGTVSHDQFPKVGNWNDLTAEEKRKPVPESLKRFAEKNKIEAYFRLNTEKEKINFLLEYDVGFGITIPITKKFQPGVNEQITRNWAKTNLKGYHYMVVEGWINLKGIDYWVVANSWGKDWGESGYCYLPFGYPILESWGIVDNKGVAPHWHVQIGEFFDKNDAQTVQTYLKAIGYDTYLVKIYSLEKDQDEYRVQVGAYAKEMNGKNMKVRIENDPQIKIFNWPQFLIKY